MSWDLKNKLKKISASEQGAMIFAPGSRRRMALIYPNEYHVGMANLGFHIIYRQVNGRGDTACERFFLPDKKTQLEYRRTNTPLLSVENQQPLPEFPLIAFAVSFEMDYFNIIKILSLGKVPELVADRQNGGPIIIVGGPCATFNPEPLADFADVCVIGEGEEVIHEILDTYAKGCESKAGREEIISSLSRINGLYVPKYYRPQYNADGTIKAYETSPGVPKRVRRRHIENLEDYPGVTAIKSEDSQFKNMYLLEIARGCGRHCRFCMAGYCFLKPRTRSAENISKYLKEAKEVYNYQRVGLVGAAISDHDQIDEICLAVRAAGMDVSAASLRADSLSPALVKILAQSGHKTITLAPEAGSERLRQVINKNISDAHLEKAVAMAIEAGVNNVRLYIMIGLPDENDEDIEAIIRMAKKIKMRMEECGGRGKLTLSINPFVPKPFTPFQWLPMAGENLIGERMKKIREALRSDRGIELIFESVKEAYIQAVLARGDRKLGKVLMQTQGEAGGWKKTVRENGLDEDFYLYRRRGETEILPWDNLSMGFQEGYLYGEYLRALKGEKTLTCFQGCRRCGVCI